MSRPRSRLSDSMSRDAPTETRLIRAAAREFNTVGFQGTNTNRIARAAGFAPQTFYRHFQDKVDVFLAVYEAWRTEERSAVIRAAKSAASHASLARTVLQHHVAWAGFRRSLRLLAIEDSRVRTARASGRESQLEELARVPSNARRPRAELIGALLTIERLCDAAADGELEDLGVAQVDALKLIAKAVRAARGEGESKRSG